MNLLKIMLLYFTLVVFLAFAIWVSVMFTNYYIDKRVEKKLIQYNLISH
jgi:hypothetical protein